MADSLPVRAARQVGRGIRTARATGAAAAAAYRDAQLEHGATQDRNLTHVAAEVGANVAAPPPGAPGTFNATAGVAVSRGYPWLNPQYPQDPGRPLPPAPIGPPGTDGQPDPRIWEYPVSWNLNFAAGRLVPFTILRQCAEVDYVRRFIEIRKNDIVALDWDIGLKDAAVQAMMSQEQGQSKARVVQDMRAKYADQLEVYRRFWERPNRRDDEPWAVWLGKLLDEYLTCDALSIFPQATLSGRPLIDGIAGDIHSLRILDGSTIKPLLDYSGGRPQPPQPAFQQILYGFPRGDYQMVIDDDGNPGGAEEGVQANLRAAQLVYAPRTRRTRSPYGLSPVEQSLPFIDLWLKREEWLRAEYSAGSLPKAFLKPTPNGPGETWTPGQRRMWQTAINGDLSGNTMARQQFIVLPPGWDPQDMADFAEKYNAEFDEWMIQSMASFFDVLPTQVGIVPKGGLGGAGHQEGETEKAQQQARRPTVEWLTDLLNDISYRFLGMPSIFTFQFRTTDEDDILELTKARGEALTTGQTTLNQVAQEQGLPLYDFPEADELFILDPKNGITFIRGLKESQDADAQQQHELAMAKANNPAPNPFGAPPPGGQQPPPPDGQAPDVQKAAEVKAFTRFAAARRDGQWRDFRFEHLDPTLAATLNTAGAAGDLDLIKTLVADVGKAVAPVTGRHRMLDRLTSHYRPKVAAALRSTTSPAHALAAAWLSRTVAKAAVDDSVRAWLVERTSRPNLAPIFDDMYRDAYHAGAHLAAGQSDSFADWTSGIDWAAWQPGHPSAAALAAPDGATGGLSSLLDGAGITIDGITDTTLDRLSTLLSDALANGDSVESLAGQIEALTGDTDRAFTIADTEMARAMSAAAVDVYQSNDVEQVEWLAEDDACPVCQENADASPVALEDGFPSGDQAPPAHPVCRCAVAPVITLASDEGAADAAA